MIDLTYIQDGPVAIYLQLSNQIIEAMKQGNIQYGEKMPSVRTLANQLNLSKTTIENCYDHLLSGGYIISKPKSGYFCDMPSIKKEIKAVRIEEDHYLYDLSSRSIETSHFDQKIWRRYSKYIYNDDDFISSYGNNQGEIHLRTALQDYLYQSRGIVASQQQIIIGAGIQPLLYLLCSLSKKDTLRIGFFEPVFTQAKTVFEDCHHEIILVDQLEDLLTLNLDYLYMTPSSYELTRQEKIQLRTIFQQIKTILIEDDHNQEMHYLTNGQFALYSYLDEEKVIFLSSFSKLLLPSLRIALMVCPTHLLGQILENIPKYNQTASKIEQEMLANYIEDGHLHRRIQSLKKLYRKKKEVMEEKLLHYFPKEELSFYETQLCFEIHQVFDTSFYQSAKEKKIHLSKVNGYLRIYIGGIKLEDIDTVIDLLFKRTTD